MKQSNSVNTTDDREATSRSHKVPSAEPRPFGADLGRRVKALRALAGMTLKEVSERSLISISALSKIENNQLSPTYENIVRLAYGLDADIAALFADDSPVSVTGRRSIVRSGHGIRHETPNYIYEMLCTDLSRKHMIPALVKVKAHEAKEFGPLLSHDGEDLLYIVSGAVTLHTEYYEPVRLSTGDCAYFDSRMGHGCVSGGSEDAIVFWVCSSELSADILRGNGAAEGNRGES
jgi:transcriptional regulator with XRE-family HTH domain